MYRIVPGAFKKQVTVHTDEIKPLRYVRANTRKKKKRPLRHVRVLCSELRQTREGAEHAHAVTACSRTQLSSLATPPPTNNLYPPVTPAPAIALSLSLCAFNSFITCRLT